jgi:hypothetical protein
MRSRTHEYAYNGIDRVDNFKGYEIDNCVPCCYICNYAKRDMSKDQFLAWVKRIYMNQYRKVTDITPGQLVDSLATVNMKCFLAQEDIMKYKESDPELSLQAAIRAQELNDRRSKLMRTIDAVLDFSEDSPTEKTYHTYFENKK